jgi:hypothetical protein
MNRQSVVEIGVIASGSARHGTIQLDLSLVRVKLKNSNARGGR